MALNTLIIANYKEKIMANLFNFLFPQKAEPQIQPLKPVVGANSAGIMPDGSLAGTNVNNNKLPNVQLTNTGALITSDVPPEKRVSFGEGLANALLGNKATPTDSISTPKTDVNGNMVIDTTVSQNPRVGGIFPDITAGYRENKNTPFSANNFGQNDLGGNRRKGLAYRLGEGLGSLARLGESPLGRGLIMGGIVGATGGNGLQALAYGAGTGVQNQTNRMQDSIYRKQLKNIGMTDEEINSINGYISHDVFKNITAAHRNRWNKTSWGDLAKFNSSIADVVNNNPSLENSFVPASVATTILKGELTDAQIKNLLSKAGYYRAKTNQLNSENKTDQTSGKPIGASNNGGLVRVQAPDGTIRKIPADKVGEAIAAGGKLL